MSAKHNNDAKITTSISKSFANNKKEELMKVINEAKAKLENVSIGAVCGSAETPLPEPNPEPNQSRFEKCTLNVLAFCVLLSNFPHFIQSTT